MVDEEQGCLEIAQQLRAVEMNAITNVKHTLVHDHADHFFDIELFEQNSGHARVLMDEFKSIMKYL